MLILRLITAMNCLSNSAIFIYCILACFLYADDMCYTLQDNVRANFGLMDTSITSVSECLEQCTQDNACTSVTWNRGPSACFVTDTLNPEQRWDSILLKKVTSCPSPERLPEIQELPIPTDSISLSSLSTCLNKTSSNGTLLTGLTTYTDCVEVCRLVSTCLAVNWRLSIDECYFVYVEPTVLICNTDFNYITKGACDPVYDCSETSTAAETTMPTFIPNITEATLISSSTWQDTQGYFRFEKSGKSVDNNLELKKSRIECATMCVRDLTCNGFTYNKTVSACHLQTTNYDYKRFH